jgi:prephenate dehydrogenase
MKTIAAGGFRDITRIASSSPVMWQNICASNREPILTLMDQYIALLQELRTHIDASEEQALLDFFRSAKDYRDSMALPSVKSQNVSYELFVDLVDEAGGLASVTRILADHAISIKNISIINNREYEEGVLLLNFADEDSRTQSERVLTEKDYTVHRRR